MILALPHLLLGLLCLSTAATASVSFPLTRRGKAPTSLSHVASMANRLRAKYSKRIAGSARRSGSETDVQLVNLDADSSYALAVDVGTPPQTFGVILDTGSSDMWLVSSQCASRSCLETTSFDTTTSSSFVGQQTQVQIEYGSGAVAGTVGQDTVTIGSLTAPKQTMAIVTRLTADLIEGEVSGLVGLAFEELAQTNGSPLWQTLSNDGELSEPMMSFALTRFVNNPDAQEVEPGGDFTLGGTNASLFTGSIDFVNLAGSEGFWSLPLTSLQVNGQSVQMSSQFAIIDSGTTLIAGPTNLVEALYSSIEGSQQGTGQLDGLFTFPCNTQVTLSVSFGSQTWTVSPADFNIQQVDENTCVGGVIPVDLGGGEGQSQWIFGDTFMKNVYSVFRFQPASVGFAQLSSAGSSPGTEPGATGGSPASTIVIEPTGGSNPLNPLPSVVPIGSEPSLPSAGIISNIVPSALLISVITVLVRLLI